MHERPIRVLVAGTFDGIHPGHEWFLNAARALGDELVVIVARDANAVKRRGYAPTHNEQARLKAIQALPMVTEAILGNEGTDFLSPVVQLRPDVLALGYDQWPNEAGLRTALTERGLSHVQVVRLGAFEPDRYHSSLLRNK